MFQPRADHTATLLNSGKVLVAGGYDASGAPTATSEIYDPATGLFTTAGNLPSKSTGHTATLLSCACSSDGKVLVVGGGNSSSQIFDPAARTWSSAGGLGSNRSYHTATALQSGKVFIVGGSDNSSKTIGSTLLFDPATGSTLERAFPGLRSRTSRCGPSRGWPRAHCGRPCQGRQWLHRDRHGRDLRSGEGSDLALRARW